MHPVPSFAISSICDGVLDSLPHWHLNPLDANRSCVLSQLGIIDPKLFFLSFMNVSLSIEKDTSLHVC